MGNLRVTLVQTDLVWEDPDTNLLRISALLKGVETDMIVLPEMFSTGFSMNPSEHHHKSEKALNWMIDTAKEKSSAICGSLIVKDNNSYYNRLYFVKPNGSFQHYDKRHLFTLAGEEKVYSGGSRKLLIEYRGWKITPLICYDLRFPVWCRNVDEADLMLFVANWPQRRAEAWKTLLKARAIENMCYVLGVNRVGDDGNEIYHSGDSALYDELGVCLSHIPEGKECVTTYEIVKENVDISRKRFNFLNDRDSFKID